MKKKKPRLKIMEHSQLDEYLYRIYPNLLDFLMNKLLLKLTMRNKIEELLN